MKYSIDNLKHEEKDLKEIIENMQNSQNMFSNAIIIVVAASMIIVGYSFRNTLDNIITFFPQAAGGIAFVAFITALLKYLSGIDYFNNLIFYKQALSALVKAQDIADKKNRVL